MKAFFQLSAVLQELGVLGLELFEFAEAFGEGLRRGRRSPHSCLEEIFEVEVLVGEPAFTAHPHRRNLHINERLPRLLDHCPELRQTHDLVRRFATMLDNHDATPLPGWLNALAHSGLAPLVGLAGALREDQDAVAQGITTPYNSGVNEGRITDVKLQKRLMAGRASVPLLRHRVVLIAHLRRRYADLPTGPRR
ncbi:hypothetical protein [Streptomyces echinatus]|uniref:hypothetical protein n=1 Tax=Streptomyces echinatus TaxID=67293 RepID=UPI003796AF21